MRRKIYLPLEEGKQASHERGLDQIHREIHQGLLYFHSRRDQKKAESYRQILIIYRFGKNNGRWHFTQTSANISRLPTSVTLYRFLVTFMDKLKETSRAKYLGITTDSTLSWNSHIYAVTKRASQTAAFFAEMFQATQRMVGPNATTP